MKQYGNYPEFTVEHISRRKRRENTKRWIFFILTGGIFLCAALYFFLRFFPFSQKSVVTPLTPFENVAAEPVSDSKLLLSLVDVVTGEDGEYAVVVKQLEGDEEAYLNEDTKFWSASLYKLWVMAAVYQSIEDGKLSLDTELSGDVVELNTELDIASESAELSEGEVSGTVAELLHEMITISGNYPAYLLGRTVGMGNVAKLLREYGWDDSNVGNPPKTSARDIADYFEKLYRGSLVSEEASAEMLALLSQQRLNDRIPEGVPENTKVAHKTGELDGYKHDVGIVYAPFGDYILVILSNTPSQERAVVVERELSRVVWGYLSGSRE